MCLVTDNLNLVHFTVRKYFASVVNTDDYEDYVQLGNIGLIKASKHYDESKGAKFSTFACRFIWGEIARYERDLKNLIKAPRSLYNNNPKYRKVVREYLNKHHEYPSDETISELTGIDIDEVIKHRQYSQSLNYIESTGIKDDCNYNLAVTEHHDKEVNFDLARAINKLSEIDKKIIMLYYYEDCNQPKIANILGVQQVYVSRHLQSARKKIKELLGDNYVCIS